jgi:hypothetical protein
MRHCVPWLGYCAAKTKTPNKGLNSDRHRRFVPRADLLEIGRQCAVPGHAGPGGSLPGGFVPPVNFFRLHLLSRQMQKLTGVLAREKNRLHKALTDGGAR